MKETIQFNLKPDDEFIPLMSLLKVLNLVGSGAEAGTIITQGMVYRNGEIELRKRAKITSGETIRFEHYEIKVM